MENTINNEAEISRLTWAVLDGNATDVERQRLAELVNNQHKLREASPDQKIFAR